jgi:hypothetical protein
VVVFPAATESLFNKDRHLTKSNGSKARKSHAKQSAFIAVLLRDPIKWVYFTGRRFRDTTANIDPQSAITRTCSSLYCSLNTVARPAEPLIQLLHQRAVFAAGHLRAAEHPNRQNPLQAGHARQQAAYDLELSWLPRVQPSAGEMSAQLHTTLRSLDPEASCSSILLTVE